MYRTLGIVVALVLIAGCDKTNEQKKQTPKTAASILSQSDTQRASKSKAKPPAGEAKKTPAAKADKDEAAKKVPAKNVDPSCDAPSVKKAQEVWGAMVAAAHTGDVMKIIGYFDMQSKKMAGMKPFPKEQAKMLFDGKAGEGALNGGRVVIEVEGKGKLSHAVFFWEKNAMRFGLHPSMAYKDVDPGSPAPLNKPLTLAQATEGIPGKGTLRATIKTSMGDFHCELYEDAAPGIVANFVGLARGKRGFKDPKTGKWVKKPYYDGLIFHRVIPGFMIQGGCPLKNGMGGPGYSIADEFDLEVRHTKGGLLSMANAGPNTNGSQFFITEKPTFWLDDRHSIFGACQEVDLVKKITSVKTGPKNKPVEDVIIEGIEFSRGASK